MSKRGRPSIVGGPNGRDCSRLSSTQPAISAFRRASCAGVTASATVSTPSRQNSATCVSESTCGILASLLATLRPVDYMTTIIPEARCDDPADAEPGSVADTGRLARTDPGGPGVAGVRGENA